MKRILIGLIMVLMLWGCSAEPKTAEPTTQPPTEPPGMYIPQHAAETATAGAVRAYDIQGAGMALVDDGIAVWQPNGGMAVYETEEGRVQYQSGRISNVLAADGTCLYYYDDAVCRYDYRTEKHSKWELPGDIQGDFFLGTQTQQIYYCTEGKICALDMQTGVSKMIKSHTAQQQALTGAYFAGSMLGWQTENGTVYLSTADGTELSRDQSMDYLLTQGQHYYALRTDGMVRQIIAGTKDGDNVQIHLPEENLVPVLEMNGILQVSDGLTLDYIDLTTGRKTAAVTIPGENAYKAIVAGDGFVWILTESCLYRWQIDLSAVTEETVYTAPVYTAQAPDTQGLTACRERIDALEQTHGIEILIADEAVANPGDHALTMEHQLPAIEVMLAKLEPLLQNFPEGFLGQMVASGTVKICLVRTVNGQPGYVRYWDGGNCYIAIALEADMQEAFLVGMGGVIDSHILGNSRDLEYWNSWNPKGFKYQQNEPVSEDYAKFVGEYFVDTGAMSFANEDRARTFWFAMTEGNEELFAQPVLQKKLKAICEGIREAYDLKKNTETFPWEQYLEKSLAYVEKK